MIDHKQDTWPDSWKLLEHGIRSGRYTDPEFCKLEHEKLWLNVWQMATRVDAVSEPGEFVVYDIGHQSVIVVRNEQGEGRESGVLGKGGCGTGGCRVGGGSVK